MPEPSSDDPTRILAATSSGDPAAAHHLSGVLYAELRKIAEAYLQRERRDHTLQPTALVHEAWIRLIDVTSLGDNSETARRKFFGIAARSMRQILVDHARRRLADKRGQGGCRVTLSDTPSAQSIDSGTLVDLDDAITALGREQERLAQVAELRLFGGLTIKEIAELLCIAYSTAKLDWSLARAMLSERLGGTID